MNNDNWTPVSTGIYPDDNVVVQLTVYSGWEWERKRKRNCEIFGYRRNGKWVEDDGKYIDVIESDRVIAWRKCIPYQENQDKHVSTTLIDEMIELKKNLVVVSENNMQEALNNLSDAEKEVLLRLYVEDGRK